MWKQNGQRSPCRPPSSTARKDATVAVALAEAMAKGIPGATVHVIVGEGHFANGPAPAGPSTTVKQASLEVTMRIEHSGSFGKMGLDLEARQRSLGVQLPQVGLGELDQLRTLAGQDGPGRVQGEALDLAVGELGRQRQFLPGGGHVDQGRAVVVECPAQRVVQLAGLLDPDAEQPDARAIAARSGLSRVVP